MLCVHSLTHAFSGCNMFELLPIVRWLYEACRIIIVGVIVGNRFVVIRDPQSIEDVLRAEGRYPDRNQTMTAGIRWLTENRAKQPSPFAMQ